MPAKSKLTSVVQAVQGIEENTDLCSHIRPIEKIEETSFGEAGMKERG
jgi:hypothetical protein